LAHVELAATYWRQPPRSRTSASSRSAPAPTAGKHPKNPCAALYLTHIALPTGICYRERSRNLAVTAVTWFGVGSSPARGAENHDRKLAVFELTANVEGIVLGVSLFPQLLRDS